MFSGINANEMYRGTMIHNMTGENEYSNFNKVLYEKMNTMGDEKCISSSELNCLLYSSISTDLKSLLKPGHGGNKVICTNGNFNAAE